MPSCFVKFPGFESIRSQGPYFSVEEEFSGYQPDDAAFRRAKEDRQGARSAANPSRRIFVHACRIVFRCIDLARLADVLTFARIECVSSIRWECAGASQEARGTRRLGG